MKQYNNITTNHVLQTVLSSVVLAIFLLAVPSISFAAKAVPTSGAGGLPYQAPLQPLPQGVGANISNNIQQTENSGPPDSATTVPPAEVDAGVGLDEDALAHNTTSAVAGNSSSRTSRTVLWLLVVACLTGLLGWLWFVTNRHASK